MAGHCYIARQFLSHSDGEWMANEATVVQCAEQVQCQSECQAWSPEFETVWSGDEWYKPVWAVGSDQCLTAGCIVLSPTAEELVCDLETDGKV
jgi:hypothetical protein